MRIEGKNRPFGYALTICAALVAQLACGGGSSSSPTAPSIAAPTPTASAVGTYGTQPCCCSFWTYTLTRASGTTSWSCWGWIEVRTDNGGELTGITDMERADATACPNQGECINASAWSSGRLDGAGALTWAHGAGTTYSDHVAEKNDCTVVSDGGTMTGTLIEGALSMSSTSVLRCGGKTAELTLSARGVKTH